METIQMPFNKRRDKWYYYTAVFKKTKFTAASNNLEESHIIFEQKELDSKSTYYIVLFI